MAGEVAKRSNGTPTRYSDANDSGAISGRVVNPPRTEYVYLRNTGSSDGGAADSGSGRSPSGWANRVFNMQPRQVPVPNGVPKFLGNANVLAGAWIGSMILIGFDEWHNNGILPRPARLWYTSLVFGILALVSMFPPIAPLCNALGIGYFIMLLWQYFNGQGQFGSE